MNRTSPRAVFSRMSTRRRKTRAVSLRGRVGSLAVAVAVGSILGSLLVTPAWADEPAPDPALEPLPAPLPPLPPPAPSPTVPAQPPAPIVPASPPPTVPKPPCEDPCEDDHKKQTRGSAFIGVRTQWTSATNATTATTATNATTARETVGVALAGSVGAYNDESGILASRTALSFALGSGSGGVEGLIGGALLVGARARVTANQGPFVRIGLSGEYQGNSRYLYSRFDLPLGELGYQFVQGPTLFEVGGRLSPVLTGRLRTDFDRRELGTAVSYGGFLAARGEIGRVELTYTRQTLTGSPFSPVVSTFQGHGCLSPISIFVVCVEGQILASAGGGTVSEPTIATLGGTIGLGAFGSKSSRR